MLNDSPQVSEDARERVQRTIEELGYRRSSTARNLSLGRTRTIGVVAPFITTGSVVERLRGVAQQLRRRGEFDLLLVDVETLEDRAQAFHGFARSDRVDGLLVISLRPSDADAERLRRDGLPVVLVDVGHAALPHVVIDDVLGGTLATEHLLAKGHRRIGVLGDASSPLGFTSSEQRRRGMRLALQRAGIKPTSALTTVRQPLHQTGARGAELLLCAIEARDSASVQELAPLAVIERRTT